MSRFPILSLMFLAACSPSTTVTRYVVPEVSPDLRRPCPPPDLAAGDVAELAGILVEFDAQLATCNGRIVSIDQILTDAETRYSEANSAR